MRLITNNIEVVVAIAFDRFRSTFNHKPRQRKWFTADLKSDLLKMIRINMDVSPGPHELARFQISLLS